MATIITKDTLRASVEAATGGLVTVLYDEGGHPSYMRRIPKCKIEDVYPDLGLTGTHPAFIVNGVEKSELFIGVYPASVVDKYGVSLPGVEPAHTLNFDQGAGVASDEQCRMGIVGCHGSQVWLSAARKYVLGPAPRNEVRNGYVDRWGWRVGCV